MHVLTYLLLQMEIRRVYVYGVLCVLKCACVCASVRMCWCVNVTCVCMRILTYICKYILLVVVAHFTTAHENLSTLTYARKHTQACEVAREENLYEIKYLCDEDLQEHDVPIQMMQRLTISNQSWLPNIHTHTHILHSHATSATICW